MSSGARRGRTTRSLLLAVTLLAAPACGGPGGGQSSVTVFAAASLTDAFTKIAGAFEAARPGVRVTLNLGSSAALAQQIVSGAPAGVFAAASPMTMQTVVAAGETGKVGEVTGARVFARNRLQIVVPPDNPGRVAGLGDLAREDLTIALCAPEVPCGAAAADVFAAAGLTPAPDTLEQDVRAVLSKVRLGEVDAALVYRTDVLSAGKAVTSIAFAEAERAANDYLIATLRPRSAAAQAFVDFVLSAEGQAVLADAGFERP